MTTEELKKNVAWEFERKIAAEMAGGENTEAFLAYVRIFGPSDEAGVAREALAEIQKIAEEK